MQFGLDLRFPALFFVLNGATIFGLISLLIASAYNIIKLLFLIPVTYIFAYFYKENAFKKPVIPWDFVLFFYLNRRQILSARIYTAEFL